MDKLSAFQHTGGGWRGTTPAWWFGAPLIAGAYVFLTPRYLPELVPATGNSPLRWMIGLVVAVAILSIWQIGRRLLAKS